MLRRTAEWLAVLAVSVYAVPDANACTVASTTGSRAAAMAAAREAVESGNLPCARRIYSQLMFDEPDNVDYVFGYAQVLYWSGENATAVQFLALARSMAPDYEDVWKLEAKIRNRQGPGIAPDETSSFERLARQRFGDAEWLDSPREIRPWNLRWMLSADRARLDNDAPDWERQQLMAELTTPIGLSLSIIGANSRRFDAGDRQFGGAIGVAFNEAWSARTGYLASSSATHLPKAEAWLELTGKLGTHWVAHTRIRGRDYDGNAVGIVDVAVERYAGPHRFEYALSVATLDSERAISHRVGVNRYFRSGVTLGAIAAIGEEIDVPAPGQLRRLDSRSFVLTSQWPVGFNLAFHVNLGAHEYRDVYRRIELGLAVSGAF